MPGWIEANAGDDVTFTADAVPLSARLSRAAAGWVRDTTVLWVLQKGAIRSYDFTNPAEVKETTVEEPAKPEKVPQAILDALRAALAAPDTASRAPEAPKGRRKNSTRP